MLSNLDEVVNRWNQKCLQTSNEHYSRMKVPGFSSQEINNLEQQLGVQLHPTVKSVLQRLRIERSPFSHATVGVDIVYLSQMNNLHIREETEQHNHLQVGSVDGYAFILDNSTGVVYVVEDGYLELQEAARNLEEFVCRIATIDDIAWSQGIAREFEAEKFIEDNDMAQAYQFWVELIRQAA